MAFHVRLTPRAASDAEQIYITIAGEGSAAGHSWYKGLIAAIYSLDAFPARCEMVPSLSRPARLVRKLLYGRKPGVYRIYFEIAGDAVLIYHIRHGARREPRRKELG